MQIVIIALILRVMPAAACNMIWFATYVGYEALVWIWSLLLVMILIEPFPIMVMLRLAHLHSSTAIALQVVQQQHLNISWQKPTSIVWVIIVMVFVLLLLLLLWDSSLTSITTSKQASRSAVWQALAKLSVSYFSNSC